MPVQAPPHAPQQDELDALIEEARRRARRRRFGYAAALVVATLVGAGLYIGLHGNGGGGEPRGSRERVTSRPCDVRRVKLMMGYQGATGFIVTGVTAKLVHGPTCTLNRPLRFAVRRPHGRVVQPIAGNPNKVRVHTRLHPGKTAVLGGWAWAEWCRDGRRFKLTASLGSEQASKRLFGPPRCDFPATRVPAARSDLRHVFSGP
jgi:hypothetical protein